MDLVLSPFGLVMFATAAMICALVLIIPARYSKRSAHLVAHFRGVLSFFSQEIRVSHASVPFRIARMGRGSGAGQGGSYPVLWTYVSSTEKCIIGHAQAGKYTLGQFLILPAHQIVSHGDRSFLVGGGDGWRRRAALLIESDEETRESLGELMQRPFDYLTIANEVHVSWSGIQRRCVLRLQVLPEDIYTEPSKLEARLELLLRTCNKLEIAFSEAE